MVNRTVTEKSYSDELVTVEQGKGDQDFPARLSSALGNRSGTWLSKQLGTSASTVNGWLRGSNEPGLTNLVSAADVLGVSVQWLATGKGSPSGAPQPIVPPDEPAPDFDQDFALIPRYEVNLSAGPGLVPAHEDVEEKLAFSKAWLCRNMISATHSGLVRVRGDSMAPTIPDGALALVNTAEARVDREGIYAFSRDGAAYVKRLVPVAPGPGGAPTSIVIISDGGSFPPEFVTGPQLNELRIVGRVRCILVNM